MRRPGDGASGRSSAMLLLQVILVPLTPVAALAAILFWGMGLDPAGQLARGALYGCLFLACAAVGGWKFSLKGTGITGENVGRGLLYAGIILVVSFALIFALQPPEGLADAGGSMWAPILFYLAVALAEETWFRGLILKALHSWKGPLTAVLGSAVLFGLMHVPAHG